MAETSLPEIDLFGWHPRFRGAALNPEMQIVLAVAITWGILILLAFAQGVAIGSTSRDSALYDPVLYARFLLALPLLLYVPQEIDPLLQQNLHHFLDTGLVKGAARNNFARYVDLALRARNSRAVNVVGVVLVYAYSAGYYLVYRDVLLSQFGTTWHTLGNGTDYTLTLAGWWYLAVSQPLFHFVLLAFLYRLGIMWWLFVRISKLELSLNPLHADLSAGLGFLRSLMMPLRLFAFAVSTSCAGSLADLLLWSNAKFGDYQNVVIAFVLLLLGALLGPFFLFTQQIRFAWIAAILANGRMVTSQLEQLKQKWRPGEHAEAGDMLTVPDFSASIDLSSLVSNAQKTSGVVSRGDIVQFVLAAAAPFLGAAAVQLPIGNILLQVLQFLG